MYNNNNIRAGTLRSNNNNNIRVFFQLQKIPVGSLLFQLQKSPHRLDRIATPHKQASTQALCTYVTACGSHINTGPSANATAKHINVRQLQRPSLRLQMIVGPVKGRTTVQRSLQLASRNMNPMQTDLRCDADPQPLHPRPPVNTAHWPVTNARYHDVPQNRTPVRHHGSRGGASTLFWSQQNAICFFSIP